jgi:hypothetical protein
VAVTVALSIVVHSSTDIPVARLFRSPDGGATAPGQAEERAGARPELGS